MRLLIIETSIRGHRPSYLQRIVREAIRRDIHVTLAMAEDSFSHPVIEDLHVSYSRGRLEFVKCAPVNLSALPRFATLNLVINEIKTWRFYASAYEKSIELSMPDSILLPYLDNVTNAIALFGAPFGIHTWSGIVMRQRFHYQEMEIVGPAPSMVRKCEKKLFFRLLRKVKKKGTIFSIDPTLIEYISTQYNAASSSLRYLPDPADIEQTTEIQSMRVSMGIPIDSFVILLYGSLSVRKGLSYLLSAFSELNDSVHILLSGRQSFEFNAILTDFRNREPALASRVHEINRYITDAEAASVFKSANIVWVGYSGHYTMSGVMIQAARSGVPILATREGLIGWLTKKFNVGIITDTTDTPQIVEAIKAFMDGSVTVEQCNFQAFYAKHTVAAFHRTLFDVVQSSIEPSSNNHPTKS